MTTLQLEAPFTPMRRQWDFARACVDEQAEEIPFAGSIRGGKTQASDGPTFVASIAYVATQETN